MLYTQVRDLCREELLLPRLGPQILRDIKVHEIRVVEDDALDRALHLVALVRVGRNDVHHFGRDVVLVAHRDAREWVAQHFAIEALDDVAARVLVELEGLADVSEQRARDEMVEIDRDAIAKGLVEHARDRDALFAATVQVFDVAQVDVAGEECEGDLAEFVGRPTFAAATGGERFVPDRGDVVAQRCVFDVHEVGEQLGDVFGRIAQRFFSISRNSWRSRPTWTISRERPPRREWARSTPSCFMPILSRIRPDAGLS